MTVTTTIDPKIACLYVADRDGVKRVQVCSLCNAYRYPKALISDKTQLAPVCADCCRKQKVPLKKLVPQPKADRPNPPEAQAKPKKTRKPRAPKLPKERVLTPPKATKEPKSPKTLKPHKERPPKERALTPTPRTFAGKLRRPPETRINAPQTGLKRALSFPRRSTRKDPQIRPKPNNNRRCKASENTLGVQFGCITPRRLIGVNGNREAVFECDCTCGKTDVQAVGSSLRYGRHLTCGEIEIHERDLIEICELRQEIQEYVAFNSAASTEQIAQAFNLHPLYATALLNCLSNRKRITQRRPVKGCPTRIWALNTPLGKAALDRYQPTPETDLVLGFIKSNPGCSTGEIKDWMLQFDYSRTPVWAWICDLKDKGLIHYTERSVGNHYVWFWRLSEDQQEGQQSEAA